MSAEEGVVVKAVAAGGGRSPTSFDFAYRTPSCDTSGGAGLE